MNLSKKELSMVALVLMLALAYGIFFSDWFRPKFIRVEHSIRSSREGWAGSNRVASAVSGANITFALHKPYKLTSVKVILLAAGRTNEPAPPVWHLVSKNGSPPVDGFAYGFALPGMSPAMAGASPQSLEPGADYRLLVEAGSLKGTNDFKVAAAAGRR